ncbi:MAG TPA: cyclic nucleotide-binding domain-containing protein [Burkholderiaceae bacterium]
MNTLGYIFGFAGAALMVTSYLMKSMLPLRIVALLACLCLVIYGAIFAALPTLALYLLLIPINIKKTLHIRRVVKAIEESHDDTPVTEWLLPHMSRREVLAGTTLWRQGEIATEMLYLQSGSLRLVEIDQLLGPESLVGEIGLFAPDRRRTLSLEAVSDCTLYSLSDEAMMQLYFEAPKLGYHVMRLIVARLMADADRARKAAPPVAAETPA